MYTEVICIHPGNIVYTYIPPQSSEQKAKEELQQKSEESEARYEMQLTALNENLTTIRADHSSTQYQLEQLSKTRDDLMGEKLGMSWYTYMYIHCNRQILGILKELDVYSSIGVVLTEKAILTPI